MSEVRLKISPPWVIYALKLQALFDGDPQIACNIDWSSAHPSIVIATNNGEKAAALMKLLPEEKEFGNVTMAISVDCPNVSNRAFVSAKELYETAFDGNPVFAYVITTGSAWYVSFTYVCFKNVICQFFCDNLRDPRGLISVLYQDIAEEIFEDSGLCGGSVSFCTDVEIGKLGKEIGQWP